MNPNFLFTSESVTEGHPDKMADNISDAILDECLKADANSRVACETLLTTGLVMVAGEITTAASPDFTQIIRNVIKDIGYDDTDKGFDYKTCGVMIALGKQSPDIAMGVDESDSKEQGAGDQGLMFGYATDDTPELMPLPISFAHRLAKGLTDARKNGVLPYLRPDGKSQVTVEYENNKPKRIQCIVLSTQHDKDVSQAQIKQDLIKHVIPASIPDTLLDEKTIYHINPTGQFIIGGPMGDCGLTGRKIIVDTYGGMGRHGGGAFSGKDPSKVDRSAAYAARYIAKNIVGAGLARECEVQLSYAIGISEPISISINAFGTEKADLAKIEKAVWEIFPLKPSAIIKTLQLKRPIYRQTAAYGHFGRDLPDFTWEKLNQVENLKNFVL